MFHNFKILKLISAVKPSVLAFFSAVIVHGGIAFWAISDSNSIIVQRQAMQISFVAPSSQAQQKIESLEEKISPDIEKKNALKKKLKSEKKNKKQVKSQKNLIERKTSGREDPNSLALKAAESEPIFNAVYLNNSPPLYPTSAKRRGIQGEVMLDVLVSKDGKAEKVKISRSSGSYLLDEAAIAAVKNWKFIPAKVGSKAVEKNVIVPVEFKIV